MVKADAGSNTDTIIKVASGNNSILKSVKFFDYQEVCVQDVDEDTELLGLSRSNNNTVLDPLTKDYFNAPRQQQEDELNHQEAQEKENKIVKNFVTSLIEDLQERSEIESVIGKTVLVEESD